MSDGHGEVSEVSGLTSDSAPNLGDATPPAEAADHVAQGEPRNYSDDTPEAEDPLRTGAEDDSDRQASPSGDDVS